MGFPIRAKIERILMGFWKISLGHKTWVGLYETEAGLSSTTEISRFISILNLKTKNN